MIKNKIRSQSKYDRIIHSYENLFSPSATSRMIHHCRNRYDRNLHARTSFLSWYIVQRFQQFIRYKKFRGPRGDCITIFIYMDHMFRFAISFIMPRNFPLLLGTKITPSDHHSAHKKIVVTAISDPAKPDLLFGKLITYYLQGLLKIYVVLTKNRVIQKADGLSPNEDQKDQLSFLISSHEIRQQEKFRMLRPSALLQKEFQVCLP